MKYYAVYDTNVLILEELQNEKKYKKTADSHLTTVSCFYKLCADIKMKQKSTPASPLHP